MRHFKNITAVDENECQYCFGANQYEIMHLGGNGEPQYYMQDCDHSQEDAFTSDLRIKRIRPTPFEVVGGQMDTILRGIRL